MKQRDSYVDVAKGICMLLIICIHTEVFGVIGMPLTFIAVPMFFFMSGFYDRSERPIRAWLPKALKTLIVPAIAWVIIGTVYSKLLQFAKGEVVPYSFNVFSPCEGNGPAWFLLSLFYVRVIMGILFRLRLPKWLLLIACFVIGYFGSMYQMPLNIDEALAALPLYFVGKQLYPYVNNVISNKWIALCGAMVLLMFVLTPYYYNIGPSNPLFRPFYLLSIGGAFFVFDLILYISNYCRYLKCLQQFGEKTLGIMLVHSLLCHTAAVILNRIMVNGSPEWITTFLIAYLIIAVFSYYLTTFIEKYCPILLGKWLSQERQKFRT